MHSSDINRPRIWNPSLISRVKDDNARFVELDKQRLRHLFTNKTPFRSSGIAGSRGDLNTYNKYCRHSVTTYRPRFRERKYTDKITQSAKKKVRFIDLEPPLLCRKKSSEVLRGMQKSEFEPISSFNNQDSVQSKIDIKAVQRELRKSNPINQKAKIWTYQIGISEEEKYR